MSLRMNFRDSCAELKRIREEGLRDSERVVDIWDACVSQHAHRLGDEKWAMYEQVFVSALDCGHVDAADACLDQLEQRFPGSRRIRRYQAMRLEADSDMDGATAIYRKLLEDDKLDSQARKRLVAVLKARGKPAEAVKELTTYLQDFCTDFEAWLELSELYLNEGDYKKAAFCLEELLLSNPHHHLYHQRYAEIKYTEGGPEAMELAKSYFAQAVRLNPANMRALYGLLLAAGNCATAQGRAADAASRNESARLAQWAGARIAERYRAASAAAGGGGGGGDGRASASDMEGLVAQLSLCCSPSGEHQQQQQQQQQQSAGAAATAGANGPPLL